MIGDGNPPILMGVCKIHHGPCGDCVRTRRSSKRYGRGQPHWGGTAAPEPNYETLTAIAVN
eukprot:3651364-Pyramimonas_sp.AAC.1